ncbi:DNA polymerase III epsilon subunit [Escherichia coli]|nr:DNA polymerase III epsilon subunit [Escherichia coli]
MKFLMTTIVASVSISLRDGFLFSRCKIIEIAITRYELETQRHIDSLEMRFNPRETWNPSRSCGISLGNSGWCVLSNRAENWRLYGGM